MKKLCKILGLCVIGVLILALLVVCGFSFVMRLRYADFYDRAEHKNDVPGLEDGLIQQGITNDGTDFLFCGYMNDGSASRIYMLPEDGKERYVPLLTEDGKPNTHHTGGLCYWNGTVFCAAGEALWGYSLAELKANMTSHEAVRPSCILPLGIPVAFCHVEGDTLYVGEFYREQNYPTDPTHHRTTASGDSHHAWMCTYTLSEDGLNDLVPNAIYSIPDLVQGMCVTPSGRICLSTSYGLATSHLLMYSEPKSVGEENGILLYELDSSCLAEDMQAPPMAEELVCVDGRVYIMNESASTKYIFGKLMGGAHLYSVKID